MSGDLLQSVWVAANVPKICDEVINRLVRAIVESNGLAKEASEKAKKGQGGVSAKAHSYRPKGYQVQVLASVRRNVEVSELNHPMARVENELNAAEAKPVPKNWQT
jgi:hypothetical protein